MKVIVVDDDITLTLAYKYYFSTYRDFDLVGIYHSVTEALESLDKAQPDIIISDISMPKINGIDGIKLFREKAANVKIIIISIHDDLKYILQAIENKANGYITKPINKESLHSALSEIKNNETFYLKTF